MLIRSSLGLLHVIFRTFVPELWPLIYAKILYPLNILRQKMTDFHQILYIPDKKRNAPQRFSPLRSPFNRKMLIVMKYSFLIKSD